MLAMRRDRDAAPSTKVAVRDLNRESMRSACLLSESEPEMFGSFRAQQGVPTAAHRS
jgi:hypothetical protein